MESLASQRRWFADLLLAVHNGEVSASQALSMIEERARADSRLQQDREIAQGYNVLQHYAIDEDIRAKDGDYATEQRRDLLIAAENIRKEQ